MVLPHILPLRVLEVDDITWRWWKHHLDTVDLRHAALHDAALSHEWRPNSRKTRGMA